jgi:hypothetical protein
VKNNDLIMVTGGSTRAGSRKKRRKRKWIAEEMGKKEECSERPKRGRGSVVVMASDDKIKREEQWVPCKVEVKGESDRKYIKATTLSPSASDFAPSGPMLL